MVASVEPREMATNEPCVASALLVKTTYQCPAVRRQRDPCKRRALNSRSCKLYLPKPKLIGTIKSYLGCNGDLLETNGFEYNRFNGPPKRSVMFGLEHSGLSGGPFQASQKLV